MGKAKKPPARRFVVGSSLHPHDWCVYGAQDRLGLWDVVNPMTISMDVKKLNAIQKHNDKELVIYELVPRPDLLPKGGA